MNTSAITTFFVGWTMTVAVADIPWPEHPRPDFQRMPWLNLNGPWQFAFDLDDKGVNALVHYVVPPHLSDAYAKSGSHCRADLPITEQMANTVLSLPIGPHMQMSEVDRVIQALTLDANG